MKVCRTLFATCLTIMLVLAFLGSGVIQISFFLTCQEFLAEHSADTFATIFMLGICVGCLSRFQKNKEIAAVESQMKEFQTTLDEKLKEIEIMVAWQKENVCQARATAADLDLKLTEKTLIIEDSIENALGKMEMNVLHMQAAHTVQSIIVETADREIFGIYEKKKKEIDKNIAELVRSVT